MLPDSRRAGLASAGLQCQAVQEGGGLCMKELPHANCALQEPGADARQDRAPGLLRNFSISRGSQAARSPERGGGGSPMGKLLRRTSLAQHPQESNMVPPGGSFRCTRSGGPGWHAGCWYRICKAQATCCAAACDSAGVEGGGGSATSLCAGGQLRAVDASDKFGAGRMPQTVAAWMPTAVSMIKPPGLCAAACNEYGAGWSACIPLSHGWVS